MSRRGVNDTRPEWWTCNLVHKDERGWSCSIRRDQNEKTMLNLHRILKELTLKFYWILFELMIITKTHALYIGL